MAELNNVSQANRSAIFNKEKMSNLHGSGQMPDEDRAHDACFLITKIQPSKNYRTVVKKNLPVKPLIEIINPWFKIIN